MNRSTKVILISSGVLIGAGIILGGIGLAVSGDRLRSANVEYIRKEEVITEDFSNILMQEISSDIRILPSDDGNTRIVYYDTNLMEHEIVTENDTLKVLYEDNSEGTHWWQHVNFNFSFNDDPEDHDTILYLPEDSYGNLSIEGVSSDISVPEGFGFNNIDVTAISGNISVLAAASGNISANTTSGDVILSSGTPSSAEISVISGDISISDMQIAGRLNLNTTSGKMTLSRVDAGSCAFNTISGDITFADFSAGSIDINTTSGDISGNVIGEYHFDVNTTSGEINLPDNISSGLEFDISTISGDVDLR
ncbi:MAG: DUF4097 family beta strand repeat protein [Clostridiales bacterium]|nr:DUF4097 family beta strand repeat protein [Clostridiales bacterium]